MGPSFSQMNYLRPYPKNDSNPKKMRKDPNIKFRIHFLSVLYNFSTSNRLPCVILLENICLMSKRFSNQTLNGRKQIIIIKYAKYFFIVETVETISSGTQPFIFMFLRISITYLHLKYIDIL